MSPWLLLLAGFATGVFLGFLIGLCVGLSDYQRGMRWAWRMGRRGAFVSVRSLADLGAGE